MRITIHRGTDQIGGCITEYEQDGWHLFVDFGTQLPGHDASPMAIEGLTRGDLSKTALLLTHYHGDHIGEIDIVPDDVPIYMGKLCREIAEFYMGYVGYMDEKSKRISERISKAKTFSPGRPFRVGPFKIQPLNVDHSAFDAYAFRIEADGESVFHTGDFRSHGFRGGKFDKALKKHIGHVDYVVCEATNICRPDAVMVSENELQRQYIEAFRRHKHNVVYVSSTNIDRIFGLYRAAIAVGRPFYVDKFQKEVLNKVVRSKSLWTKSKLYNFTIPKPRLLEKHGTEGYQVNTDFYGDNGFVILARANSRFEKLLSGISDIHNYLSMWDGYLKEGPAYNEALAKALKSGYEYLHTSGHCDVTTLAKVFEILTPKAIIAIHTDDPKAFREYFSSKWSIIDLKDGQTF